ncbi:MULTISPECIES: hypothetical protein [unclassified Pseudomonas]|uniref:hypothetical protein n=1 Tax=unclassified Pseudomonas TaxID=196821 RepID=UPI001F57DC01|nr:MULTISPECIES: hypothetical protein [unclassified Pseudomonas]
MATYESLKRDFSERVTEELSYWRDLRSFVGYLPARLLIQFGVRGMSDIVKIGFLDESDSFQVADVSKLPMDSRDLKFSVRLELPPVEGLSKFYLLTHWGIQREGNGYKLTFLTGADKSKIKKFNTLTSAPTQSGDSVVKEVAEAIANEFSSVVSNYDYSTTINKS